MRFLDLYLLAFGPFFGTRLDLGRPGVLHLIFGPNEAGKSTALRAISDLRSGESLSARILPPFDPPSLPNRTAAGFFFFAMASPS